MATVQELVDALVEQYPDDADDLRDALGVLQKQKVTTVDRLAKLKDSQWQRLDFPMGIEAILRDEAAAATEEAAPPAPAPAPAVIGRPEMERSGGRDYGNPRGRDYESGSYGYDAPASYEDDGERPLEPFEAEMPTGMRSRRGGGGQGRGQFDEDHESYASNSMNSRRGESTKPKKSSEGLVRAMDLTPPADLEDLWQQLLEDTLPPDKRSALQESWKTAQGDQDKYMMFLEYSSYLRKPEVTEEEKVERRKQLEPLMREFGIDGEQEENGWSGVLIWWLTVGGIFFVCGIIYYLMAAPESVHDTSQL